MKTIYDKRLEFCQDIFKPEKIKISDSFFVVTIDSSSQTITKKFTSYNMRRPDYMKCKEGDTFEYPKFFNRRLVVYKDSRKSILFYNFDNLITLSSLNKLLRLPQIELSAETKIETFNNLDFLSKVPADIFLGNYLIMKIYTIGKKFEWILNIKDIKKEDMTILLDIKIIESIGSYDEFVETFHMKSETKDEIIKYLRAMNKNILPYYIGACLRNETRLIEQIKNAVKTRKAISTLSINLADINPNNFKEDLF